MQKKRGESGESWKKMKKTENLKKKLKKRAPGYGHGVRDVVDYFSPANERRRESSLSAEPVAGRKDRAAAAQDAAEGHAFFL